MSALLETARQDQQVEVSSDSYLTFALGGDLFALGILEVSEIMAFRNLTEVPMMPAFIQGVINVRGRVVPVVDLLARFGRGSTDVCARTSIVIVEAVDGDDDEANRGLGIMVDAVNKVVRLSSADMEPPPSFGAAIDSQFINGMARCDGGFLIVLDSARVFSLDDMATNGWPSAPSDGVDQYR